MYALVAVVGERVALVARLELYTLGGAAYGENKKRLVGESQLLGYLLMVECSYADATKAYLCGLKKHRLRYDAQVHIHILRLLHG